MTLNFAPFSSAFSHFPSFSPLFVISREFILFSFLCEKKLRKQTSTNTNHPDIIKPPSQNYKHNLAIFLISESDALLKPDRTTKVIPQVRALRKTFQNSFVVFTASTALGRIAFAKLQSELFYLSEFK